MDLFVIQDPHVNSCSRFFILKHATFQCLNMVNTIISSLLKTSPSALAKNAFHCIQCRLHQVVDVPDLIRIFGSCSAELHSYRVAVIVSCMYARESHRITNRYFPRCFVRGRESGGAPYYLDRDQMTSRHSWLSDRVEWITINLAPKRYWSCLRIVLCDRERCIP